jgi:SAM-dependent methyltransferase
MVAAAKAELEDDHRFVFAVTDAAALPFGDGSFDVVVANHMLYHVTDLDRAVTELRRVVAPGGRLVAATNGPQHLAELADLDEQVTNGLFDARARFVSACEAFGLHNGAPHLEAHFNHVVRHGYDDRLVVTEVEPIVAYLQSSGIRIDPTLLARLRDHLARRIDSDDAIEVTKDTGLFTASP